MDTVIDGLRRDGINDIVILDPVNGSRQPCE